MSARLCSPAADLPPDDLLLDVFLRLPPEPRHLYAVSRVCRRWRRLVRCAAFLCRFRAFHRTPPVLGIFQNTPSSGGCFKFFPTDDPGAGLSQRQIFQDGSCEVLDCRHGLVLLLDYDDEELLVWDPMDDEVETVSLHGELLDVGVAGAVVCAAGHDDHTDCHSCPFQVILMEWRDDEAEDDEYWATGCVYSSETEEWSEWTSITFPADISCQASALVGDSVYWKLKLTEEGSQHILEFDLSRQTWDTIKLPYEVSEMYMSGIRIMPAEDGGLGFAGVSGSSIDLWSRMIHYEVVAEWELVRKIDMDTLTLSGVPAGDMLSWSSVVGYAEDSNVLFLKSEAGVFMINLESMQLKKVCHGNNSAINPFLERKSVIYPYSSFYTPGCDIAGIDVKDVRYGIKYEREKKRAASKVEAEGQE